MRLVEWCFLADGAAGPVNRESFRATYTAYTRADTWACTWNILGYLPLYSTYLYRHVCHFLLKLSRKLVLTYLVQQFMVGLRASEADTSSKISRSQLVSVWHEAAEFSIIPLPPSGSMTMFAVWRLNNYNNYWSPATVQQHGPPWQVGLWIFKWALQENHVEDIRFGSLWF